MSVWLPGTKACPACPWAGLGLAQAPENTVSVAHSGSNTIPSFHHSIYLPREIFLLLSFVKNSDYRHLLGRGCRYRGDGELRIW
jgi:hypothetical protein